MKIINAKVFTEDNVFVEKEIYVDNDRIVDADNGDGMVIDGAGCYAIPGLTDIHFHGCVGYDFCDGTTEAITKMAKYEASIGVTTMVPATMTLSEEQLTKVCQAAKEYDNAEGAILCGINMEGPFIAESKKGAQNGKYIHKPDAAMFDRLNKASGNMVKLIAIAPEVEGAMDFIEKKKDEVVLSIAHTACDYAIAKEALEHGASHMTHLYNAMNPLTHRAPGPIGAAAENATCEAELICDGVHIHPAVVKATFQMFSDNRMIMISDSMMATGMPDGKYALGGQAVDVKGNLATLADGTIAGSATNLMDCVRTAVQKMGIPLESAIKCAAVNPAKSVKIYDKYGSITPGKVANIVLLNQKDLSLNKVILKGMAQ
ncbi:MAG: N-acetylglucosamine-6-phosphate deacetylase [Lachnospiraceae bacterium]|nr:N-acetylglucosamine-6-phosphate deacetylase [Lachnospiraceae bacterium]